MRAESLEQAMVPRFVDYVDDEVRVSLPRRFPTQWVAEESCRRVADVVATLEPEAAEALVLRAASFLDDVLLVMKRDELPFEPEECLYLDLADQLHLIGARRGRKVRVDPDLNLCVLRERPLKLEGPRAISIRGEVRELVSFTLGSADKKPVGVLRALDLSAAGGPGAFFLELDAPAGTGYVGGRFDRLRAYGDGKLLIVAFRPMLYDDEGEDLLPDGDESSAGGWRSRGGRGGSGRGDGAGGGDGYGDGASDLGGGGGAAGAGSLRERDAAARSAGAGRGPGAHGAGGSGAAGAGLRGGAGAGAGASGAAGGAGGSDDAAGAAARNVPPIVRPLGGAANSDSPFDQPGWAASVAPDLAE